MSTIVITEQSPIFKARAAGFFWLVTFVTGAIAMAIGGNFIVNGDAGATAAKILSNESAFRLGATGNLIATACYLTATLLVYELLKPVNRTVSLLAAFFSLLGCGIGAIVFFLTLAPLVFLGGAPFLNAFTVEQLQALTLMSLKLSLWVNNVGLVFFGFHILLVGYLIVASTFLPRVLGLFLMTGGLCYLTNGFASFLEAPFAKYLFPYILLPAFLAELLLTIWLLAKGVNEERWKEQANGVVRAKDTGLSAHMVQSLTIIAALSLGLAHTTQAQNPEELKPRILAQAQSISADDYAFTRTVRTNVGGNTEQTINVEKFDPTKPMRLKLVVKLQRFESTARYRIGPEGKPALMESTSEISGSGLGQEGTMKTVATYSDYRGVGGQR